MFFEIIIFLMFFSLSLSFCQRIGPSSSCEPSNQKVTKKHSQYKDRQQEQIDNQILDILRQVVERINNVQPVNIVDDVVDDEDRLDLQQVQ